MREITKTSEMPRRIVEHGRIRTGIFGGKYPKAIDHFRFTSSDRAAIERLAQLYGGEAREWAGSKTQGQWEVITEATTIDVVLPPDPLGMSPVYELWSKGGLVRRCDGEVCTLPVKTPDGAQMDEQPCICDAKQIKECQTKTRLNVVLPNIAFGGVWRLETASDHAARELPGMVEAILAVQERGFARACLSLEHRTSVTNGQTKKFIVPKLSVPFTLEQIAAGEGALKGLARVDTPALGTGQDKAVVITPTDPDGGSGPGQHDLDDEIVDAEIVEAPPAPSAMRAKMHALLAACGIPKEDRVGFYRRLTGGKGEHWDDLDFDQATRLLDVLSSIEKGEMAYRGVNEAGQALVGQP